MSEASDLFNSLPQRVRLQARPSISENLIGQLKREKFRLRRMHIKSITEINEHIASLRESVDRDLKALRNSATAKPAPEPR